MIREHITTGSLRDRCRHWRLASVVLSLVSGLSVACEPTETRGSERSLNSGVSEHLEEILALAQTHSVYRSEIDWPSVRRRALMAAEGARTYDDAENAIRLILEALDDGHSFYQPVSPRPRVFVFPPCESPEALTPDVPERIGYVRVPGSARLPLEDAEEIQQQIRLADLPDLMGWIVDLRGNTGGNVWPMLLGIGPVLGEETATYIDLAGGAAAWGYEAGAAVQDGVPQIMLEAPYSLHSPPRRIAVLIDEATVSAGEIIAVAFRGHPQARLFGQPTCGRSSVNRAFRLGNGAALFLTVSRVADREGRVYEGRIPPDELVGGSEVVNRAIDWLMPPEAR